MPLSSIKNILKEAEEAVSTVLDPTEFKKLDKFLDWELPGDHTLPEEVARGLPLYAKELREFVKKTGGQLDLLALHKEDFDMYDMLVGLAETYEEKPMTPPDVKKIMTKIMLSEDHV